MYLEVDKIEFYNTYTFKNISIFDLTFSYIIVTMY